MQHDQLNLECLNHALPTCFTLFAFHWFKYGNQLCILVKVKTSITNCKAVNHLLGFSKITPVSLLHPKIRKNILFKK